MKRILLIFALSPLLAACASNGLNPDEECRGFAKTVTLTYGDGGIAVSKAKKKVKQNKPFVIKLDPSNGFKDHVVIIDGVSVTPGGAGVLHPDWLDTQDSYNTRKKFRYCAPPIPDRTAQIYKFDVEVVGLGDLDPRVEVTW